MASSTIPLEWCDEHSRPYDSPNRQTVFDILCEDTIDDQNKEIVISITARAIKEKLNLLSSEKNQLRKKESNQ
jgi:hypothetical protein